jgi:hypothetical protein
MLSSFRLSTLMDVAIISFGFVAVRVGAYNERKVYIPLAEMGSSVLQAVARREEAKGTSARSS